MLRTGSSERARRSRSSGDTPAVQANHRPSGEKLGEAPHGKTLVESSSSFRSRSSAVSSTRLTVYAIHVPWGDRVAAPRRSQRP